MAQIGFHPPNFLPICQLNCQAPLIPKVALSSHETIQLSLSLLIHVSPLQFLLLLIPPPPALSHPSSHPVLLVVCSPMKASSLLFLLESDVFQLQWARDEANVTAFFHQTADPPVIVVLLRIRQIKNLQISNYCVRQTVMRKKVEMKIMVHYFSLE